MGFGATCAQLPAVQAALGRRVGLNELALTETRTPQIWLRNCSRNWTAIPECFGILAPIWFRRATIARSSKLPASKYRSGLVQGSSRRP
jgi:hypothetical protein